MGLFEALVLIVLVLFARRDRRRLRDVERRQAEAESALTQLRQQLTRLEAQIAGEAAAHAQAPAAETHAEPAVAAPSLPESPAPPIAPEPIAPPPALPPVIPAPPTIPPPVTVRPPQAVPPTWSSSAAPPFEAPARASGAAPPQPPRTTTPTPPRWSLPPIDWESLVGVKLFSWIAGIALVFAAVFFLRYSIEHGWLSPPIRMAIGLVVGAGLLVACELRAAQRYPVTANALDAAGIAILFSTLFASHALWHLLPQLPVLLLMTLVTAVAVLLSVRRDSMFIALLGLVGGFATPALLSTGEDRPIGLFGYLLLLNVGLAWVAYRKRWVLLTGLSVVFTLLYQWSWVMNFLDAARLPLAMAIFLVFPLLHVIAVALANRDEGAPTDARFEHIAAASTVPPLLFAIYMAVVPAYGARFSLFFAFLLLVAVGLAAIAVLRGREILHLLGAGTTVLAAVLWFAFSYDQEAWPRVLGFVGAFVLLYAFAPLAAHRFGRAFTADGLHAGFAAALFLFAFPTLVAIEPATAEPALLFTTLFVLLAAIAFAAVAAEAGAIHFLSALFALAAEAMWSAEHLTPERLLPALVLYAAFGLFYLGVPIVAERLGKKLEPQGSGAVVLFVSIAFLLFLATGPVAAAALWGMAMLLAILNLGLFFEASRGRFPILAVAGVMLSWIVIAVWWATAMVAALLVPSLLVVAGFAALVLAGNAWARQGSSAQPALDRGEWMALVGHLFLLFVASQPDLAVPPWPLFGVLALLDLAVGAAALYTRRARLHVAAMCLSQLVLMVWVATAEVPPWPLVGAVSSLVVAVLALAWIPLSRRVGATDDAFSRAAVAATFLGQAVVIGVSGQPHPPSLALLASAHALLLVGLLAVATERRWFRLAVPAVILPAVQCALHAYFVLNADNWASHLWFAAALHSIFVAYPLWLGRRAGGAPSPHLAAVLASATFFFIARQCILTGGYGGFIAVLPVTEAVVMLVVLARLLAVEPTEERRSTRVALVGGAALAFITVAIPLQLERQWITVGWVLESTALAWLYRRVPHRGLLAWSAGLAIAVMVRLCANPAVFAYHPRGDLPILNWYLYAYLVSAAALFVSARLLRDTDDHVIGLLRVSDWLPAGGAVLLFLLLNIEIADFYSAGPTLTFNFSAGLAQDLTYTLGWALFAIGLLAAGITGGRRYPRIAALALLVVTVVKCFLHDLWRLGGLYRVGSFVGLAICLAMVAVLMQRFVLGAQREAA